MFVTYIFLLIIVMMVIANEQGHEWPFKIVYGYVALCFSPLLLVMFCLPKLGWPENHWSLVPIGFLFQAAVVISLISLFK